MCSCLFTAFLCICSRDIIYELRGGNFSMANQPKKYKKFVATAATATLVAAAIVPVASAAGFTDVKGSSHEEAINALAEAGIINGYADGTFKPNQDVNRGQVVKLLGRWLETEGYEAPADWETKQYFKDLPLTAEKELLKYAALSKEAGVFEGSNGNLNFTQKMQRQQMAVVLVRAINEIYGLDLVKEYKAEKFTSEIADLDKAFSAEQREAITALEYAELTNVTTLPGKKFNPANSITRGQFASFLYRTINIDVATDASVKAINNTTVEVTFDEEVENIQALNFEIKDLEVKNAAVKQSNKKVVVLTTAPQTAGKEYTVSLNAEEIGKFKGIEAVIPTAIDVVEKSQQNVLGNQVTVKAKVTVAEGQSKAGIPVTFNIINSPGNNTNVNNSSLNQPIVAEAVTDENGVATYTYTRYASTAHELVTADEVQAYATGKATVRSFAKVYWAAIQPLTITEVATGNSINNGAAKQYKVKLAGVNSGTSLANKKVNVAFKENLNILPDKAIKTVNVTDANGVNLGYPGQYVTSAGDQVSGGYKVVQLTLNDKGETTFTLTGSNATVTPMVFVDQYQNTTNTDPSYGRFDETELFAAAAPVTFAKTQTLGLTVDNLGVSNAASIKGAAESTALTALLNKNTAVKSLPSNTGGRTYKATLKNPDGKPVVSNTPVKVSVAYGTAQNKDNKLAEVYLYDMNAKKVVKVAANTADNRFEYSLLTDKNGQISFKLLGEKDAYATPTIFTETGDKTGLDANDLQTAGEIVYFGDAKVEKAKLLVDDEAESNVVVHEETELVYSTVDQNDNEYETKDSFTVTFSVSATSNVANVKLGTGTLVTGGYGTSSLPDTVNQGSTRTYAVKSTGSKASILVDAANGTQVSVTASAGSFAASSAKVTFNKLNNEGIEAGQSVRGKVLAVDTKNNRILLTNSKGEQVYELKYAAEELWLAGTGVSEATFEGKLKPGQELNFTQKTDTTKAKFDNLNLDSDIVLSKNATITISDDRTSDEKVYDFGGKELTLKELIVNSDNVVLKNGIVNGTISTGKNVNDFGFDTFTHNGTFNHNYGDGNTLTLKDSKLDVVNLAFAEHIDLDAKSVIKELNLLATGASITGEGTVEKLIKAKSTIDFTKGDDVKIKEVVDLQGDLAVAKSELQAAIKAVKPVKISTDGADVPKGEKWTTAEAKTALDTAVTKATKVLEDAKSTTTELKEAKAALAEAVKAYEAVQKDGSKVVFTVTTSTVDNTELELGLVGTTVATSDATVATAVITEDKIEIKSVKAGTATISVKDKDNNEATITVTVDADGKITIGDIKKYEKPVTETPEGTK